MTRCITRLIFFFLYSLKAPAFDYSILNSLGTYAIKTDHKDYSKKREFKSSSNLNLTTGKKSTLRMSINGEHILNIAPNSALSISSKESLPIIHLHYGIARLKTKHNEKNKDYKILLSTNSSSLGVRGTEFIITHNKDNQITSVLTFEGEVDFYKKNDNIILKSLKEQLDTNDKLSMTTVNETELRDNLSRSSTTKIMKNKFSGAYPSYDYPLRPIKISDGQLKSLKKNNSLKQSSKRPIYSKKHSRLKFKLSNKNLIPEPLYVINESKIENTKNKRELSFVRDGGIIDLDTGIYIMPPKGAYYNINTKQYELPSDYGGYDQESGRYIPPNNTKIDPLKGFVKYVNGVWHQVDSFSKGVEHLLKKYKKVTRVDLNSSFNYKRSNISLENYYGEYRDIGKSENMSFNFQGDIGRHLYHSRKYLHYINASLETKIHNRTQERLVQRNDLLKTKFQYNFQQKNRFLKRQALSGINVKFTTEYKDIQNKDQFDFYTESTQLSLFQKFYFTKRHSIELETGIKAFQSFNEKDHGNIKLASIKNEYHKHHSYLIFLNFSISDRQNKIDNTTYDIQRLDYGLKVIDLLRKTDLKITHLVEKHKKSNESSLGKGTYNELRIALKRRKGEYLSFDLHYHYSSYDTTGNFETRSFRDNALGLGASFNF